MVQALLITYSKDDPREPPSCTKYIVDSCSVEPGIDLGNSTYLFNTDLAGVPARVFNSTEGVYFDNAKEPHMPLLLQAAEGLYTFAKFVIGAPDPDVFRPVC